MVCGPDAARDPRGRRRCWPARCCRSRSASPTRCRPGVARLRPGVAGAERRVRVRRTRLSGEPSLGRPGAHPGRPAPGCRLRGALPRCPPDHRRPPGDRARACRRSWHRWCTPVRWSSCATRRKARGPPVSETSGPQSGCVRPINLRACSPRSLPRSVGETHSPTRCPATATAFPRSRVRPGRACRLR